MSEKEELTQNIEKTQARLDRAAKLTTGLADEQIRWAETVTVRYMHSVYIYNGTSLHRTLIALSVIINDVLGRKWYLGCQKVVPK